ncbi:Protein-tyrosine phosphatase, receptor/non-receptor type [Metarhizium album ARSEF 1941]|uniref:protein-tyrosine-phosphatase n=1 Tax=Metarhizium album (strain ARSEF 1941) TaxID=1081103 RepID=A0A0B2WLK4_METAS|nr:Protein-tyrosine phosphatase, receptor/non-receptor type [Metarhizium album ARSEF 1941]KHN94798.1 Protein-tyrosine phosphatase, receptor/non-receptor type [Metarhizium album ARSEF 1941]
MKTQSRHSPAAASPYSYHQSHASRSHRVAKHTTSPATSPKAPYSVGQNYPPMLSPTMTVDSARAPSPNYFGLVIEPSSDPRESSALAQENWSPGSSVKSFAAALPKQITLDPNPEFEAFKKAADLSRGKPLSIATHATLPTSHPTPVRPRPPRWHTYTSDAGSDGSSPKAIRSLKPKPTSKSDVDHDSLHDSAYISSDSKRNSESSLIPTQLTGTTPLESPGQIETPHQRPCLPRADPRESRLSLALPQPDAPSPDLTDQTRARTLPPKLEHGPSSMISGAQLKELMESVGKSKMLLLDIRSSQSFAQSRIQGALNLCIPTTLLKRATFNLKKLQQTFQGNLDSNQFSKWRDMDWIVVYDAHASDKRDAVTAQNMTNKFTNEGYQGKTAILRGGFAMFSASFPQLVDTSSSSQSPLQGNCRSVSKSTLAPVIGGVNLPTTDNNHNPFFSNIRQNMDLADGVGQFEIVRPRDLDSPLLPTWLRDASSRSDHGKMVSNKFLNIELDEQSRMKAAFAAFQPNQKPQDCKFQLCGVEEGTKNRYKDILPFEHARVRLQEIHRGSCDYVNASHLSASRSYKRYIATQGPLPATYEDFWSVIWEQDVRVIVMLTAESEGGQLKCHPYWKGRDFGPIRLKALSEKKASLDIDKQRSEPNSAPSWSSLPESGRRRANTTANRLQSANSATPQGQGQSETPYVTIRKFALSHAAHPFAPIREITHLHFAAWPDFGTPAQPSHLLALVELANVMQRAAMPVETSSIVGSKVPTIDSIPVTWYDEPEQDANSRPMLVHCSAGCGRTGAFCTVDSVIDMLKRQRQANVSASSRPRDSEGDVPMDAHEEAASPAMTGAPGSRGFFDRGMGAHTCQTRESFGIDTAWLRDDGVDLIQKTVQDFREQRLSMVQSLRQYVLCYETILEWLSRMQDGTLSNRMGGRARSGSLQQARR